MLPDPTIQERFDFLSKTLSRISPFIITEINKNGKHKLLMKSLSEMHPFISLKFINNPGQLHDFFRDHQSDLIVIEEDIFKMRKNYRDIVLGAFCSNPDSLELWPVYYLNKKPFKFRGKLILCTNKTKEEIKKDKKFEYFVRDGHFI